MSEYLIQNTTKEQRERIVNESLGYSDVGCDDSSSGYDMYLPYIYGEKELADITREFKARYIHGTYDETGTSSCGYIV